MLPYLLLAALLALASGLERLHARPFVATLVGHLVARALRGRLLLQGADAEFCYEVARLPAVGFRAAAQTWGEVVLVTPSARDGPRFEPLMAHERCHVAQYRRYTSVGFWLRYLLAWCRGLLRYRDPFLAYWHLPLEREARAAAAAAYGEPPS